MTSYAIQWTYGRASNQDGSRCGAYYRFGSAAERNAWVEAGNPYKTQPGARDPVSGGDPELRRLLRRQAGETNVSGLRVLPIDIARQVEAGI